MKKTFILVVSILFVLGVAGSAMALIANSAHDFANDAAWGTGDEDQICKPCHAPHTANTGLDTLLWNRAVDTDGGYAVYESSTLNDDPGQPDGHSKLCLSCHDGTQAINAYVGGSGGGVNVGTGGLLIAKGGTDLMGQHPVSMYYEASANGGTDDPELNYIFTTLVGSNATLADLIFGGKVQCSSCHDVHNSALETEAAPLLRAPIAGSELCLACHTK